MKSNNSDVLKIICAQAEMILFEFEEEFNKRGFLITSISLFRIVFINDSTKKIITFQLENEYNYNFGYQLLQDVTIHTPQGMVTHLSTEVNEKEYKGAFRNYFKNLAPEQSTISIFKDLVLKYFFDELKA